MLLTNSHCHTDLFETALLVQSFSTPTGLSTHYERSPEAEERLRFAQFAGALPPHPQDLSLGASPDAGLAADGRKGDAAASLFIDRSRPPSRRSGCFPALPYLPLSPDSFYLGGITEVISMVGSEG